MIVALTSLLAIAMLIIGALAAGRIALRWKPLSLDCQQRQSFALVSLFFGEVVLTLLWVGIYAFDWAMNARFGRHSALVDEGQNIVWRLMIAHVAAMAMIAIGDVVSARIGDWFEIRRSDGKNAVPPDSDTGG